MATATVRRAIFLLSLSYVSSQLNVTRTENQLNWATFCVLYIYGWSDLLSYIDLRFVLLVYVAVSLVIWQ